MGHPKPHYNRIAASLHTKRILRKRQATQNESINECTRVILNRQNNVRSGIQSYFAPTNSLD